MSCGGNSDGSPNVNAMAIRAVRAHAGEDAPSVQECRERFHDLVARARYEIARDEGLKGTELSEAAAAQARRQLHAAVDSMTQRRRADKIRAAEKEEADQVIREAAALTGVPEASVRQWYHVRRDQEREKVEAETCRRGMPLTDEHLGGISRWVARDWEGSKVELSAMKLPDGQQVLCIDDSSFPDQDTAHAAMRGLAEKADQEGWNLAVRTWNQDKPGRGTNTAISIPTIENRLGFRQVDSSRHHLDDEFPSWYRRRPPRSTLPPVEVDSRAHQRTVAALRAQAEYEAAQKPKPKPQPAPMFQ